MTKAKIKIETNGIPRKFKDLPVGSIFRTHAADKFARFIKAEHDDGFVVVSIGPFLDQSGPLYYDCNTLMIHEDTLCLDETATLEIRPTGTEPCAEGATKRGGNLLITESDELLFLDLRPGTSRDKVCFSLRQLKIVERAPQKYIAYDSYVLAKSKGDHEIVFEWSRPATTETSRAA